VIKATKLFSGVMVTKVLKLFTAGIVRWKSNFDHTLLLKLPPINCERALLVFFCRVVVSRKWPQFWEIRLRGA